MASRDGLGTEPKWKHEMHRMSDDELRERAAYAAREMTARVGESRTPAKTISSTFGTDAANELAAVAIDLLCRAPRERRGNAYSVLLPWSEVERGRAVLERHGIHWRALVAADIRRRQEARERVHDGGAS